MKLSRFFAASALALCISIGVKAQQPYGGCWFPDEVINWSPSKDTDAKFNRSRIPLQARISTNEGSGQVESATITNKMCSLTPSQGDNNFLGYQPTYWQYMDKFINWGGAGNEGIFVLPPAGTIDAAHLNGVKILGTLFFMPRTIGGRDGWIEAMLTKDESGSYPYAVKMYEIAKYFGFDGWFINKELDNGKRVDEWGDFIKCFCETAVAAGDTQMEIQWYDAHNSPTMEILQKHQNISQFLEYGSTGDKSEYASELGCSANDLLHRLYSGIECSQAGLYGFTMPSEGSVALFTPEQATYKSYTDNLWADPANTVGEKAYNLQAAVFERERNTWEGFSGFKGVASTVEPMSVITSMPFVSSFCTGLGKYRFVKGEKLNTQDWYSTSVQSILPTWRTDLDGMTVGYDYDEAYNHGNSFRLSGNLTSGTHIWRLFKTAIPVTNGGTLRIVYKTNGAEPVAILSGNRQSAPATKTVNGWTVAEYNLSALNGTTISEIGLQISAASDNASYKLLLGEIAVLPAGYSPETPSVTDVEMVAGMNDRSGDLRLSWSYDYNNDFDHFDIYLTNGSRRNLVGQTRGEGFYVPRFTKIDSNAVKAELVAVMKDGSSHSVKTLDTSFHVAEAPKVTVSPMKSYAKVGEIVTLTAVGTDTPTSYQWNLPSTVELVNGKLTDATIEVETKAEGKQEVSVVVTNAQGSSTFKGVAFEVLSDVAYKEIHNVAAGKPILCSRAVTGSADYLVDGDTAPSAKDNAWGDISTNPWVVVDLKTPHTVYDFTIYDNHSLYKGGEDNIGNYRIFVSDDAENWTEIVDARDVVEENIHHAYVVPTVARYVKLQPYDDKRMTCRLFEFEISGRDNSRVAIEAPHTINLQPKQTQTVTVSYNLNGEAAADNFGLTLSASNSFVSLSEPKDDGNGHFTFDITAANRIGMSELTVSLSNGDVLRQTFVDVILDTADAKNVVAGTDVEMRKYDHDYSSGATYKAQQTGNLTDGNTTAEGLTEDMYDMPCTGRNDLWAVFANPQLFSVGKVKIYLPASNKGESDNGKEGYVNNNISIRISKDGINWDIVKEFKNLKEVSELTCYFPEIDPCVYLAVVCDVNTYFYPSLAEIEVYEQPAAEGPSIQPIVLDTETLTYDVIAENTPIDQYSDVKFNNYYTFYTSNVLVDKAISSAVSRIIVSKKGTKFELGDYAGKNAFNLDNKSEKTLKFAEPVTAEKLYILSTATRSRDITMKVLYSDGTTSEEYTQEIVRGNNSGEDYAFEGIGTIDSDSKYYESYGLTEVELTADADKEAAGVVFSAQKTPEFWVLAISGLVDPNATKMRVKPDVERLVLAPATSQDIVLSYNLNGEERQANFALKAEVTSSCVSLGQPVEDASNATFTVSVIAGNDFGSGVIEFTLVNGENEKKCKVPVAVNVPAEFSGWNSDIIAEALPAMDHVTDEADGDELGFFTTSVAADGALADDSRVVTTVSGTKFILAPFDENNALKLDSYDEMTLDADILEACESVAILAVTNLNDDIKVYATYGDGSKTEETTLTVNKLTDDFDAAFRPLMINVSSYSWTYEIDEITKDNVSLTELLLPLDNTKELKSVSFTSGSYRASTYILALAKNRTSGINNVKGSIADRRIVGIYDLQGVKVDNPATGIYIVRYSDNSVRKVIVK